MKNTEVRLFCSFVPNESQYRVPGSIYFNIEKSKFKKLLCPQFLKTEPLDKCISRALIGLAIMVYEPLYHAL